MAKHFDVFLRRHLVECDILIQSLPYRDGISVTDRMIIDAVLQGCKLMRIASVQSDLEITAQIDRLIKTCLERLNLPTAMDASVDLKATSITTPVNEPIVLDVKNLGTMETVLNRAETGIIMAVTCLGTKLYHSLGRGYTGISVDAKVSGTKARKIETAESIIQIMADMSAILIKLIYPEDVNMWVDAEVAGSQLKRYRLMSDLGDMTLDDLGDMTLDDFYYIILAG